MFCYLFLKDFNGAFFRISIAFYFGERKRMFAFRFSILNTAAVCSFLVILGLIDKNVSEYKLKIEL
jgi:hypothetical protein